MPKILFDKENENRPYVAANKYFKKTKNFRVGKNRENRLFFKKSSQKFGFWDKGNFGNVKIIC